jgi:hypothetical protein
MAGAVMDRMAPGGRKTKMYLGPLNNPEGMDGVIKGGKAGNCITDVISPDLVDYEILFINESSLGKSPQVQIKITENFKINVILDSGSKINLI